MYAPPTYAQPPMVRQPSYVPPPATMFFEQPAPRFFEQPVRVPSYVPPPMPNFFPPQTSAAPPAVTAQPLTAPSLYLPTAQSMLAYPQAPGVGPKPPPAPTPTTPAMGTPAVRPTAKAKKPTKKKQKGCC